jgi:hypothetical protein
MHPPLIPIITPSYAHPRTRAAVHLHPRTHPHAHTHTRPRRASRGPLAASSSLSQASAVRRHLRRLPRSPTGWRCTGQASCTSFKDSPTR